MAQEPNQVSAIQIGRVGNLITCYNDGSMVLSDRFVPGIRLIDLINGQGAGGLPALTIEVNTTDWAFNNHDQVYNRDFWKVEFLYADLNMNITPSDISKLAVITFEVTNVSPLNTEEIDFESVLFLSDRIRIISSGKIHSLITIKKI
jgi:hypothetical protein